MPAAPPAASRDHRWRAAAVALAGGLIATFSIPAWGFWPLAVVGIALLGVAVPDRAAGGRALCGFAFGVGLFGPSLFWMSEFHAVGWLAAAVGYSVFYAAALALGPPGPAALVALPATLVLIEWFRYRFPFGGVPLGAIPLGQVEAPFAPAARLIGGLGLYALAAIAGVALAAAARGLALAPSRLPGQGGRPLRPVGLPAAVLAAVAAFTALGAAAPDGRATGTALDTAVVQGGGQRGLRAIYTSSGIVFERHLAASRDLPEELDLVLWPENAVDVDRFRGSAEAGTLARLAERLSATLVIGVTEDVGADAFHNVAIAMGPEGEVVDTYVKHKRVPFGEYAPGRALVERVVDLSVLPRDAAAGTGPGVLRTPAGALGVLISFEVFFAERAHDAVAAGAEVLLVPTNAASFSTSQAPAQELAAAQLRAIETGRWVLQAAPTGFSAVVTHRGDVVARSGLGGREVLTADVPLRAGRTWYGRWGDAPLLLAAAAVVAAGWGWSERRRRAGVPSVAGTGGAEPAADAGSEAPAAPAAGRT